MYNIMQQLFVVDVIFMMRVFCHGSLVCLFQINTLLKQVDRFLRETKQFRVNKEKIAHEANIICNPIRYSRFLGRLLIGNIQKLRRQKGVRVYEVFQRTILYISIRLGFKSVNFWVSKQFFKKPKVFSSYFLNASYSTGIDKTNVGIIQLVFKIAWLFRYSWRFVNKCE